VQLAFSYSRSKQEALEGAWEQWKSNMLPREKLADLCSPQQFAAATKHVTMQEVAEKIVIFTEIRELIDLIAVYKRMGATRVFLHNINRQHERFIEDYGKR
jgi:hypothetical protein